MRDSPETRGGQLEIVTMLSQPMRGLFDDFAASVDLESPDLAARFAVEQRVAFARVNYSGISMLHGPQHEVFADYYSARPQDTELAFNVDEELYHYFERSALALRAGVSWVGRVAILRGLSLGIREQGFTVPPIGRYKI